MTEAPVISAHPFGLFDIGHLSHDNQWAASEFSEIAVAFLVKMA